MRSFRQHSQRKETRYKATGKEVYAEFDQKPSKPIVDQIDRVLAEHYGFTAEELRLHNQLRHQVPQGKERQ